MPLRLSPVVKEDLVAWARLFYIAFKPGNVGCVWTAEPSQSTLEAFARTRGKCVIENDPDAFMWKVIDTELPLDNAECGKVNDGVGRQLVAVGRWTAYRTHRTPEEVDADLVLPPPFPEENREARAHFMGNLWAASRKYVEEPCFELATLVSHPLHQKRGAGMMIMRRGLEEADKLGLKCCLEGSAAGVKLYRSCGFIDQEEVRTDMRLYGGGLDVHVVMVRPVSGKA